MLGVEMKQEVSGTAEEEGHVEVEEDEVDWNKEKGEAREVWSGGGRG